LNPWGKYGPTGELTTKIYDLVGALTPNDVSVEIAVGLMYRLVPG
jgi:hypothetical protein